MSLSFSGQTSKQLRDLNRLPALLGFSRSWLEALGERATIREEMKDAEQVEPFRMHSRAAQRLLNEAKAQTIEHDCGIEKRLAESRQLSSSAHNALRERLRKNKTR